MMKLYGIVTAQAAIWLARHQYDLLEIVNEQRRGNVDNAEALAFDFTEKFADSLYRLITDQLTKI